MEKQNTKIIFDLEADGLNPTKIWVLIAKVLGKHGRYKQFYRDDVANFSDWLRDVGADEIIGHNIIGFDIPVLKKLHNFSFNGKITDTFVLSRLFKPHREGGHSLKNWGITLNDYKGEYNDWSRLTTEMVDYCIQDVKVTEKVYSSLAHEGKFFSTESIRLEHKVQRIIHQQEVNGWLLDERKANILLAKLTQKLQEVTHEVRRVFRPLPVFVREIHPKTKKDGSLSVVGLKWLDSFERIIGGPFCRVDWDEFNLGSRKQIARYLQFFGWKPKVYTDKGNVKVDESVLENVNIPEAQLIAEYLMVQKRIAQVTSWLDAVKPDDGRVHGRVNTIGARTSRMTHSNPNMAQVPASYSPYGSECRAVWAVPEGYKLVGCDASGLELRMLAHYMNDKEYTHELLNGDIHTANQLAAGLQSRDTAKTFIYAFMYGAGDAKIGDIAGGRSARYGKKLKAKFLDNTPSLKALRERVVSTAEDRGYLKGLDGRIIYVKSPHSALNYLLQGAGAIVMKKALTILDKNATIEGIDYKFIGNIHDEFQTEVKEEEAERFGTLAKEAIVDAGIQLGLRCPLDAEYKIGTDWSMTH